ncbi:DUF1028 domain-containing protein [Cesiribacter sp. SM1]|uniref:DUF1028 domain-containing protein n=1 Tax=Cesiribacter sp. SM1 TaxID=2861196 RepID=UPI001CD59349|nr:DUF1028 domain-containing protein [Cesiribacter sp. SM1]
MKILLIFLPFFCISNLFAQMTKSADPFAHTYSIVARDSATGEMAVGVQSHWFSVGTAVSWAEAGVGAVATQSFVNVSFGMRGLALLKEGKSPQEALDILLSDDEAREVRQVAIIDKQGRVAVHTGKNCVEYAGHATGTNFSVQANMMLNDKVWPAMAKSFEKNKSLPLAERVLAALQAGEAAGGDIRGKQSAALLVVKAKASGEPWNDKVLDLRVDDHPQPLQEMERLLKVFRAYEHMNRGDLAVEKGDMQGAMQEYTAAEQMFPDNLEMQYWHAITLANGGKVAEAAAMLKKIYKKDANWQELTRRLPKAGLLTVSDKDFARLLGE